MLRFPAPSLCGWCRSARISGFRRRLEIGHRLHQNASFDRLSRPAFRPASRPPGRVSGDCIKRDMKSARARWGEKRALRGRSASIPIRHALCPWLPQIDCIRFVRSASIPTHATELRTPPPDLAPPVRRHNCGSGHFLFASAGRYSVTQPGRPVRDALDIHRGLRDVRTGDLQPSITIGLAPLERCPSS